MKRTGKTAATRTTTASQPLLENQTKISDAGLAAPLVSATERGAAKAGFRVTN